jgi:hypothetical protein
MCVDAYVYVFSNPAGSLLQKTKILMAEKKPLAN